ncbi:MAG: TetR family transcriptional regulator [Pseudorhodoplanes sp.]
MTIRRRVSKPGRSVPLGRRPGTNALSEAILEAAIIEFSKNGYDGTSIKVIAKKAKCNPALIGYYFGSKQALFQAILHSRGLQLGENRMKLLDDVEKNSNGNPGLEDIVSAFLLPFINLRAEIPAGDAFMRLIGRIQHEDPSLAKEMRREIFEASTRRFIALVRNQLPHVDEASIYWRVMLMIGGSFYLTSGRSGLETYSGGMCKIDDLDEMHRQMTACFVAGLVGPTVGHISKRSLKRASR